MQPTWVPGVLSPSINGRGVKLTSHLHVVPSLGMYGDIPLRSHDLKIDITLNSCFPVRDTNILEKLLSHLSRNLTCCNTLLGFYILKKEAVKYSESVWISIRIHGVTRRETAHLILDAVRTSNLTHIASLSHLGTCCETLCSGVRIAIPVPILRQSNCFISMSVSQWYILGCHI